MKVLLTGHKGFIGNFVSRYLSERGIEVLGFDKGDKGLAGSVKQAEAILHFAGVNRAENPDDYYQGNAGFTKALVDLVNQYNPDVPFFYASSVKASQDSEYGKSKKVAEDYIRANLKSFHIQRFCNVFGPYCRPFYNNVIATWCQLLSEGKEIEINPQNPFLNLIYVEDAGECALAFLQRKEYRLKPKRIRLSTLAKELKAIADGSLNLNTVFQQRLFATYVSYLPIELKNFDQRVDERGVFVPLFKGAIKGQLALNYVNPGQTKGGHYHHHKTEIFVFSRGRLRFGLSKDGKHYSFECDNSKCPLYLYIPPEYTHSFTNFGNEVASVIIYCSEEYDPGVPDTYPDK